MYIWLYLKNFKMRKLLLLVAITISSISYAQNDVTFSVDMNDYTGDFTEIQLNGTFNAWCGSCNPMTDDDADGVWEVTLSLPAGDIEYKYTFDNWTGQESLTEGSECTLTTDGFTNRFLNVSEAVTLPVVCWESCVECTGTAISGDVTFQVDMDGYTGDYTTVNLNGGFNGWCGACAEMTDDDGDNVYELTVNISAGTIEYKFTVDGWTDQEMFTEGDACTSTIDGFTNRTLVVEGDVVLDAVCWNSCEACGVVGIEEENWVQDFSISPNPSNGIFQLNGVLTNTTSAFVRVMDIQGKIVYQSRVTNDNLNDKIDLSEMENGVYYITVASELGSVSEKILLIK